MIYHSATESTSFGGAGLIRTVYFFILITHIVLAAAILPLILITMSRALSSRFDGHRKIALNPHFAMVVCVCYGCSRIFDDRSLLLI